MEAALELHLVGPGGRRNRAGLAAKIEAADVDPEGRYVSVVVGHDCDDRSRLGPVRSYCRAQWCGSLRGVRVVAGRGSGQLIGQVRVCTCVTLTRWAWERDDARRRRKALAGDAPAATGPLGLCTHRQLM